MVDAGDSRRPGHLHRLVHRQFSGDPGSRRQPGKESEIRMIFVGFTPFNLKKVSLYLQPKGFIYKTPTKNRHEKNEHFLLDLYRPSGYSDVILRHRRIDGRAPGCGGLS